MILALISQKGGVGKSALARLVAVEMIKAGWAVKIADLDPAQGTSTKWKARRDQFEAEPDVQVQKFRDAARAIKEADQWDLLILDGPAQADRAGLIMAKAADLVILPTGHSLDDLDPQVAVAFELEDQGVPADKIRLAFCRVRGSESEDRQARDFVRRAGLVALDAAVRELPSIRQAHAMGRTAAETGRGAVDRESRQIVLEIAALLTKGKGQNNGKETGRT